MSSAVQNVIMSLANWKGLMGITLLGPTVVHCAHWGLKKLVRKLFKPTPRPVIVSYVNGVRYVKEEPTDIFLRPSQPTLCSYVKTEETITPEVLLPTPPPKLSLPEVTTTKEDFQEPLPPSASPPEPEDSEEPRTYEVLPKKVKKSVRFNEEVLVTYVSNWFDPLVHKHFKAPDAYERVYDANDEDLIMHDAF